MSRITLISLVGLGIAVTAQAGSIEIGGPSGITASYINQTAGAVCAAGVGNCVAGNTAGWAEKNYENVLFSLASGTSGTPVPFTGYTQTGGTPVGSTATDAAHNVTYAMLSDGANPANNASANFWESIGTNGGTDSITIPIGIYDVTDLWTMLNNTWGSVGGNDTSVTFNFGDSSNATSGLTSITVDLTDTSNNGGASGEIRAALSCLPQETATCNDSTNPHGALAQGTVINGVTVNTGTVYNTFSYTSISPGFYAGTQGKLKLDDQQFVFGPDLANYWLVSMTVTENVANTFTSNPLAPSETVISAITVDTGDAAAPTPEPATVLMLLTGLGGLGLLRFRRG